MTKSELFKKAHEITKQTVAKFKCDYRATFSQTLKSLKLKRKNPANYKKIFSFIVLTIKENIQQDYTMNNNLTLLQNSCIEAVASEYTDKILKLNINPTDEELRGAIKNTWNSIRSKIKRTVLNVTELAF